MPSSDQDKLVAALRAWTKDHDANVRAAVELLIWHGYWLRRADFTSACVHRAGREFWIGWREAREFVDAGPRASTSELAILDLAVALGEDRFRLGIMGHAHRRSIASAVMAACGLGEVSGG
jgi:hypothetical protein